MRAGNLDRQVLIEKKSVVLDAIYGTQVVTWLPLSTLIGGAPERYWAEVVDALPSRAESVVNSEIAVARNQTRIRIRWRNDVDSSMRITVFGETNRVMQIVGGPARVGDRKELLEMMCETISS